MCAWVAAELVSLACWDQSSQVRGGTSSSECGARSPMRRIGHFSNAGVQTQTSTLHLIVARALNIDADPNYVGAMGHGPRHDLQQQFR